MHCVEYTQPGATTPNTSPKCVRKAGRAVARCAGSAWVGAPRPRSRQRGAVAGQAGEVGPRVEAEPGIRLRGREHLLVDPRIERREAGECAVGDLAVDLLAQRQLVERGVGDDVVLEARDHPG